MSDDLSTQKLARRIAALLPGLRFMQQAQGTYTPAYVGGTTAGATTYTFQNGKYTRYGNLVTAIGQINWTAATGTGEARVSLPFAPIGGNSSGSVRISSVTFANSAPEVLLGVGAYFTMDSPLTNAAGTIVAVEAAGSIIWCVTYFTE